MQDPDAPEGTYRWDFLDGYEGEENNSLDKTPDLQAKVRRVIEQGFVDPEDFNGVREPVLDIPEASNANDRTQR